MKQKMIALLTCCAIACCAMAQQNTEAVDESEIPTGKLILYTGMNIQVGEALIPTILLGVERPIGAYRSISIQFGALMRSDLDYSYEGAIRPGSFEVAACLKNFLHGKLSGHRSGIYLGPDLRVSHRNYVFSPTDFSFPPNPNRALFRTKGATLRALLNTGWQFRLGDALVDLSLPVGIETNTTNAPQPTQGLFLYDMYEGTKAVILPTISIGYVFK